RSLQLHPVPASAGGAGLPAVPPGSFGELHHTAGMAGASGRQLPMLLNKKTMGRQRGKKPGGNRKAPARGPTAGGGPRGEGRPGPRSRRWGASPGRGRDTTGGQRG